MDLKTLQSEISRLQNLINGGRRRSRSSRRRPRGNTQNRARSTSRARSNSRGVPAAVSTPGPSRVRNVVTGNGLGTIHMSARELLASVSTTASLAGTGSNGPVSPVALKGWPSVPPQLAKVALLFEQFKFTSVSIEWEPLVGTTTNGGVILGFTPMDSRGSNSTVTAAVLAAMQPNRQTAIWQKASLKCPVEYLRSRAWFGCGNEKQVGVMENVPAVWWYWMDHDNTSTSKVMGRLWMTYDVTLQGFASN